MKNLLTTIILVISLLPLSIVHSQKSSTKYIYYCSDVNSSSRDIYRMDTDGKNKIKLSSYEGSGSYPYFNGPSLSPDGSKIVYHASIDGIDRYSIWTMNIDGSEKKRITRNEGLYPSWCSDSKTIIYSARKNGIWEIFSVSSNGGKSTNISNYAMKNEKPGWGATFSCHPDGKTIFYTHIRDNILYSMDVSGNNITRITSTNEHAIHPDISPDGSKIALNIYDGESYNLVVMLLSGKQRKTIVRDILSYSGMSWSDSGEDILFVTTDKEIFKVNLSTGTKTQLTKNNSHDSQPTW